MKIHLCTSLPGFLSLFLFEISVSVCGENRVIVLLLLLGPLSPLSTHAFHFDGSQRKQLSCLKKKKKTVMCEQVL